jgi:SAM-dependent methyltransferase
LTFPQAIAANSSRGKIGAAKALDLARRILTAPLPHDILAHSSTRHRRMHPETYAMLAQRADSYWWHRARRRMSLNLLRGAGLGHGCRWLDLGCGPGGNLGLLEPLAPALIVGLELSPIAIELAQRSGRRGALLRADMTRTLPFADRSFDVVTIFNVLYHQWVASELTVLAAVARVLRPGGLLLLTEPAFPILAREMDAAAMGRRRYRLTEITALCRAGGFEVLRRSYFTSFGFPLLLGLKLWHRTIREPGESRQPAADMKPLPAAANGLLLLAASLEERLISAGLSMPCGTTLVCLARRPQYH